jgi:hypothetical protein
MSCGDPGHTRADDHNPWIPHTATLCPSGWRRQAPQVMMGKCPVFW